MKNYIRIFAWVITFNTSVFTSEPQNSNSYDENAIINDLSLKTETFDCIVNEMTHANAIEQGAPRFTCLVCNKLIKYSILVQTYATLNSLNAHIRMMHVNKLNSEEKKIYCGLCVLECMANRDIGPTIEFNKIKKTFASTTAIAKHYDTFSHHHFNQAALNYHREHNQKKRINSRKRKKIEMSEDLTDE